MSSEILKIKQYQVTDRNVSENNNSIHKIIFILHSCDGIYILLSAEDSLDSAGWEIFPESKSMIVIHVCTAISKITCIL